MNEIRIKIFMNMYAHAATGRKSLAVNVFVMFYCLMSVCVCDNEIESDFLLWTVLLTEATWIYFMSYRCFCCLSCFTRISSMPARPGGNTAEVSCCNLTLRSAGVSDITLHILGLIRRHPNNIYRETGQKRRRKRGK